jgi:hypothetical protein
MPGTKIPLKNSQRSAKPDLRLNDTFSPVRVRTHTGRPIAMKGSSLVVWLIGIGLSWSIPALVLGIAGIVLGGAIGGTLAGVGTQLALISGHGKTSTSLRTGSHIAVWLLAMIVGQILLRDVAVPLGSGSLGVVLWVLGSAVASGISGAVGGLGMAYVARLGPWPSLRAFSIWSVAMFVGGVFGGILAAYHQPILIGLFGYSSSGSTFLVRAAVGFFAAGALTGLIAGVIAMPRVPVPAESN